MSKNRSLLEGIAHKQMDIFFWRDVQGFLVYIFHFFAIFKISWK